MTNPTPAQMVALGVGYARVTDMVLGTKETVVNVEPPRACRLK